MIYGFVQQRRVVETRVQIERCQQQLDSLNLEAEKMNKQLESSLKQLQIEKNLAVSALREAKQSEKK